MKKLITLLLALIMVFGMAACGAKETEAPASAGQEETDAEKSEALKEAPATELEQAPVEGAQYKEELIIGVAADCTSLDPHAADEIAATKSNRLIFSTLLYMEPDTQTIRGDLAESYEQVAENEIVFHLRHGVKFHSGDEMTAEDVKFSLDRARNSARVKAAYQAITDVQIMDEYTVKIVTDGPNVPILAKLCLSTASIVCKRTTEADPENFEVNGTGPYKLVEWRSGDRIIYERFDDYFEGPVPTKRQVHRVIPEDSARLIALENGEIDICEVVPNNDLAKVADNANLTLLQVPSGQVEYFAFNTTVEPLGDPLVRQAIACAINKQAIIDATLNGEGMIARSNFAPSVMGYYSEMYDLDYDVEKAQELMAQSSVPDGFTTHVILASAERELTCQLIQADLSLIGIELIIDRVDSANYFDTINNGRAECYMGSQNNAIFDPDRSAEVFHTDSFGAAGNRMYYSDAEMDALIEAGRAELDNEKRMEIYKQIQEKVISEAIWIPLNYRNGSMGVRNGVGGFKMDPCKYYDYSTAFCTVEG